MASACREYMKSTAVPKHIEKRRSELESEGYQVLHLCVPPVNDPGKKKPYLVLQD